MLFRPISTGAPPALLVPSTSWRAGRHLWRSTWYTSTTNTKGQYNLYAKWIKRVYLFTTLKNTKGQHNLYTTWIKGSTWHITTTNTKGQYNLYTKWIKGSTCTRHQQIQRTVQFIHLMAQKGPLLHYNNIYKGLYNFYT